jgi:hypothetical protein
MLSRSTRDQLRVRYSFQFFLKKKEGRERLISNNAVHRVDHKRFCSFVATSQDISLIADTQIVATFDESSLMAEQDAAVLRVIQVHFSGSNIERCGIVRYVSKPLSIDACINMFYLSTFMTANIIVSAHDLERAVGILSHQQEQLRIM